MSLLRAQARIHIVEIGPERRTGHRARDGVVQPVDEIQTGRRIGRSRVARVAVMLQHPEGGAVAVCGRGRGGDIDLAVRTAVEVDYAEPRVGGVDAVFDDVGEVAG